MVKEVVLHEVAVALVVGGGQTRILVQVHGTDLAEIQVAGLIARDQLLVHPDGGGPGGETQHAVGLQNNMGSQQAGSLPAHGLIIFGDVDLHVEKAPLSG